jgi:hypothetical protein
MEKCIEQPVAKAHHGHHGSLASLGHPAQSSSSQAAHASSASSSASASHVPASPAHAAPSHAAPAKPSAKDEPSDESARSEAAIPSLSPSVPGLDSAVIPAPLNGVRSTWGTTKDAPPAPKADAISDPDGVLE